ncbi:SDR family NAD(P)-dependent oxidoreductase [Novosphingobium pentaromativorans]|uniref:Short-chain dehydrogenase/reductase SDR n=1 Tax=Novosphingobium pentaromativorans US6-1 TaxID=1088721 RepID=G6E882_9SPHN|nr:SDR family NAD(P)-dependent oxidoreductase [Novosphingobium pentaromativorans]EHJ62422.1 hypothetical protein NSU_0553 [Novosphingobium pentaromativorans US6-1]
MENCKGKVAIVTGGASGIGFGIAQAAARRGADIVLADIAADKLEAAAAALRDAAGVRVIGVPTDVADPGALDALAEATYREFGRADMLFNNAGISSIGASWETSLECWRKVVDIDLFGCIHGIRSFLPKMLESGEPGYVVNTASLAGLVPTPHMAPYAVSKHAVVGLSGSLAQELRMQGAPIKVAVVCPGYIATPQAKGSVELYSADAKSDIDLQILTTIGNAAEAGMKPEEAGEIILSAMEKGDFWIAPNGAPFRASIEDLHKEMFRQAF